MRFRLAFFSSALLLCIATVPISCSPAKGSTFDGDDDAGTGDMNSSGGGSDSLGFGDENSADSCNANDDEDKDQDGYSKNSGDCNDCDANVNPDAIEVMTEPNSSPSDENCNGQIDEAPTICDDNIAITDGEAINAARALEICNASSANGTAFGLISAQYVRASGALANIGPSTGIMSDFGATLPRQGARMLALSSGYARDENDAGACGSQSCSLLGAGTAPPGFPQNVPGCAGSPSINDDIGLEVQLRAPSNATGYSFDFAFYSFEHPEYVCTEYNDQFIALVTPPPMGSINGNISFDSQTNPVSVNIALFDHCDPNGIGNFAMFCQLFGGGCPAPPTPYCPLGTAFMSGSGFETWGDAGSTGWLVTTAPVEGGAEFSIRFAIWDTGDTALDSTVLIDNFQWIATPGTDIGVSTTEIPK